jgi:outer membrane protein insertion porin family
VAGLGGDAKFWRSTGDLRSYPPVTDDGVVAMTRAQGGTITPWGGQSVPLLNNFFGGPQLVRGFATNGFGPRDVTPGTTFDNIGGTAYWATTAEIQAPFPLLSSDFGLKVSLFSDAGSVWNAGALSPSLSQSLVSDSKAVRSSVGAGLVWDSFFGPLRLDYAYPLSKSPYDVTQRLHFSAGMF